MTLKIDISPDLEERLQKAAAQKGVAAEDYARMLLEERLLPGDREHPSLQKGNAWSVLKSMMGTVEGPPDWSSELDHYLYGAPKRGDTIS